MRTSQSPPAAESFSIREAGPADAVTLAGLVQGLNVHERMPVDFVAPEAIRRHLEAGHITALLAEAESEAVGHCLYHYAYESTYAAAGLCIVDLFVTEAWRGQGIGKALIAEVARRAKAGGGSYVWWTSKPENEGANAAYARIGAYREPVIAHAVFDDSFEALVALAEARERGQG